MNDNTNYCATLFILNEKEMEYCFIFTTLLTIFSSLTLTTLLTKTLSDQALQFWIPWEGLASRSATFSSRA